MKDERSGMNGDGLGEAQCLATAQRQSVISRLNARVLWFFQRGQRIIVVHGVRHEGQKLPPEALRVALARKTDWERRQGR